MSGARKRQKEQEQPNDAEEALEDLECLYMVLRNLPSAFRDGKPWPAEKAVSLLQEACAHSNDDLGSVGSPLAALRAGAFTWDGISAPTACETLVSYGLELLTLLCNAVAHETKNDDPAPELFELSAEQVCAHKAFMGRYIRGHWRPVRKLDRLWAECRWELARLGEVRPPAGGAKPARIDPTVGDPVASNPPPPKLAPAREKAYGQYLFAVKENAALDGAPDRQVYDWLKENQDETLPRFATWAKYLREARAAHDTSKHTSRAGRTGRSIVTPDQL